MPRSCHQPKPLEVGCREADPKLLKALSVAELPDQPHSLTCEMNMGAGSDVGYSLRTGPQAGPSLHSSSALHCLEQLGGRDVPPGWQPPAVSPSQAVSFSRGTENRAPVMCLRGVGQGPFPSYPTGPVQLGALQEEEEGKHSHYMAGAGPALLCKLSLGKPGSRGAWQGKLLTSMAA